MIDRRRDREFIERERVSVAKLFQSSPPHDLDAERSVLGSVLLENNAFDDVQPHVPAPERFYSDAHRRIFGAILCLLTTGQVADAVTVATELQKRDELDQIGGIAYLLQILETVPHAAHAEYYARTVAEKWKQRAAIDTLSEGLREAHVARESVQEVIAAVESKIRDLGQETATEPANFGAALDDWVATLGKTESHAIVQSGYGDLDQLLVGGLRGSQLIVLAARPGVGKSAFAGNVAMHVALSGKSTLMVILEQSKQELVERLLSAHSRIDHGKIQKRDLDQLGEMDAFAVEDSGVKLRSSRLFFDDTPRRTVSDIGAICRRHQRKHGLDLLVIDYLQLLQPDDPRQVREQQVSSLTRNLKFLAKDLGIPVLCLAQLNRGVESREDKTPRLSDLRESGAIEQDADIVMFIDRPILHDKNAHPADAVLHVPKNRSGQPGKVDLVWRGNNLLFLPKSSAEPPSGGGDW